MSEEAEVPEQIQAQQQQEQLAAQQQQQQLAAQQQEEQLAAQQEDSQSTTILALKPKKKRSKVSFSGEGIGKALLNADGIR